MKRFVALLLCALMFSGCASKDLPDKSQTFHPATGDEITVTVPGAYDISGDSTFTITKGDTPIALGIFDDLTMLELKYQEASAKHMGLKQPAPASENQPAWDMTNSYSYEDGEDGSPGHTYALYMCNTSLFFVFLVDEVEAREIFKSIGVEYVSGSPIACVPKLEASYDWYTGSVDWDD